MTIRAELTFQTIAPAPQISGISFSGAASVTGTTDDFAQSKGASHRSAGTRAKTTGNTDYCAFASVNPVEAAGFPAAVSLETDGNDTNFFIPPTAGML